MMKKILLAVAICSILLTGCVSMMNVESKSDGVQISEDLDSIDDATLGKFYRALVKMVVNPEGLSDEEWNIMYRVSIKSSDDLKSPFLYISEFEEGDIDEKLIKKFKADSIEDWNSQFDKDGNLKDFDLDEMFVEGEI